MKKATKAGTIFLNVHKIQRKVNWEKNMGKYKKGNLMTSSMIMPDVEDDYDRELSYLMPVRAREIQWMVNSICDQMEYDGSLMYDIYPDRILVEKKVNEICEKIQLSEHKMLVQVMLCKEMAFRRERRKRREKNYLSSNSI